MTSFAGRPGTAVEPMWSTRRASGPSASRIEVEMVANSAGQLALGSTMVTRRSTSVLYRRDRRARRRGLVPPGIDLVPLLDRARKGDRSPCVRLAEARWLQSRESRDAAPRRCWRPARRREGVRRCGPRPRTRSSGRDTAPLRARRDRGTDVADLSSVRRWSRQRNRMGIRACRRLHRVLHRVDPRGRRRRPAHHCAAEAKASSADSESPVVRSVLRGDLGTGGCDANGPRRSRRARPRCAASSHRGCPRRPRDRRTGRASDPQPRPLRSKRAPGARAGGDMNRLHALTDGVYAIAMTLLVLELHVPDARSSTELIAGLVAIAPNLFGFALGFAVLGTYWVGSAVNLSHLARVNRAALFLNVLQ